MEIRGYQPEDFREMVGLFYDTVHEINAADYTKEQLDAWADGQVEIAAWNRSFLEHETLVAEENGIIVGFADMDDTGYLDRLYVHKNYQKKGIASALCEQLEMDSDAEYFTTYASITARPFFEKRGYRTVKEQQVLRRGVTLTNYVMKKLTGKNNNSSLAEQL